MRRARHATSPPTAPPTRSFTAYCCLLLLLHRLLWSSWRQPTHEQVVRNIGSCSCVTLGRTAESSKCEASSKWKTRVTSGWPLNLRSNLHYPKPFQLRFSPPECHQRRDKGRLADLSIVKCLVIWLLTLLNGWRRFPLFLAALYRTHCQGNWFVRISEPICALVRLRATQLLSKKYRSNGELLTTLCLIDLRHEPQSFSRCFIMS